MINDEGDVITHVFSINYIHSLRRWPVYLKTRKISDFKTIFREAVFLVVVNFTRSEPFKQ